MKYKKKYKMNYSGNLGSKVPLREDYKTSKEAERSLRYVRKYKLLPKWKRLSVVKTYRGYTIAGVLR
jgi:hypothetical protein